MRENILRRLRIRVWRLRGYDTLAGEWYPLPGLFITEGAAMRAARRHLARLERWQPGALSGGQAGVQDQVYIVRPDGTVRRCWPDGGP